MPNIFFITAFRIDKNKGGVRRVTATLAGEFIKKNYNVYYLALSQGNDEIIEGVPQYYLPERKLKSKKNKKFIKNLLKKDKIEIVINQTGISPKSFRLISSCINSDIKLYTVHHNCIACLVKNYRQIVFEGKKNNKVLKLFDNNLFWKLLKLWHIIRYHSYFKRGIMNSTKLVLLFKQFIPELSVYIKRYDANKVIAIPNPLPFEIKRNIELNKENRMLYVGRINYQQKRTDLLIDIWSKIFNRFPDWHLDVVGDGPLRLNLENKVKELNLKRIHFYGFQDPKPYYEKAKFFLLTSTFEGYGMVLVEAQAYGAVPIAFNCFSAINQIIINKKNGIIINSFNIDDYIERLSYLMKNDLERKIMAENGFESVARYLPKNIISQWEEIFNTL